MKKHIYLVLIVIAQAVCAQPKKNDDAFIVKPYLQLGYHPTENALQLLWHAADDKSVWTVQLRADKNAAWQNTESSPIMRQVNVAGIAPHAVYSTALTHLASGSIFSYRILKNKQVVFSADAHAPKASTQAYRFLVFGDCGAGTPEQKPLTNVAWKSNADMIMIPGDIVYEEGLISEYYTKFWPIYNAEKVDTAGAPLLRSIPFVASPGNHDTDTRDLDKHPDALAYYIFWEQPLNGPLMSEGSAAVPPLKGADSNRKNFTDAAGSAWPRMSNFSFDYGNAHWTVIDSNPYVDWTDSTLTAWVAKDLAAAKNATWRFVAFHHPGFNSSREHYEQQQMRLLAPIFEAGNVDIVFNGHVHNYQRSFPLRFVPDKKGTQLVGGKSGKTPRGRVVNGQWTLDKEFNGKDKTSPKGIIYIVTGAGGQELYNPEQNNDPDSWQKFTDKFNSVVHSLTVADVDGKTLTVRQLSIKGEEIDSFQIRK